MELRLQPLRIPAGWTIAWNTLYETARADAGDFGGSSLFHAVHTARRFALDVAFRPEFDPQGQFHLAIDYQPWPRTPAGRRRTDQPLVFTADAEPVHSFETASYPALVAELEAQLARCSHWQREGH